MNFSTQVEENERKQIKTNPEGTRVCNGNFEAAMHYDCGCCSAECEFRKGGAKTSEMIAVMCFLAIITIVIGTIAVKLMNYLLKILET